MKLHSLPHSHFLIGFVYYFLIIIIPISSQHYISTIIILYKMSSFFKRKIKTLKMTDVYIKNKSHTRTNLSNNQYAPINHPSINV